MYEFVIIYAERIRVHDHFCDPLFIRSCSFVQLYECALVSKYELHVQIIIIILIIIIHGSEGGGRVVGYQGG